MVCFSEYGTIKLIDHLSEDHDIAVQCWRANFEDTLEVLSVI